MSYSILRVQRVKGSGNTKGIQKHNQRENNNYNNKDIRHEDTHKNYDLINNKNIDYKQIIDEKIDTNYTGNRKIRADAIRHIDGLITSDNEFFSGLNEAETNQFFRDGLDFLEEEYGEENLLYATVHLDEKVPHMHFGFVPLTDDGRLSAKEKLGNKKSMTELQDRFNQHVNSRGYSLERGTAKQVSEREHKDIDKFKKDTQFHQQELQKVQQDLKKLSQQLNADIASMRATNDFEYENEVEVTKGLFTSREERETGRKVISAEEFEKLQQTISAASNIVDDYERIKDEDYYKKYNHLLEQADTLLKQNKMLERDNQKIEEENKMLDSFVGKYQRFTEGLYKYLREHFKGFEEVYNDFSDKLQQNEKMKVYGQFMDYIQDNVYEQDRKQQKDIDLER